jgi:hypothetical protein
MPEKAHVSSIDAIESFRAALLIYLNKARPVLDDACGEVVRTREWLRSDRRLFWEDQLRRRTRDLEQAQQALFSAEIANLRAPSTSELLAVQRTKRSVQVAQEKLKIIKRWTRDLDNRVEPLVKQLEQLRGVLSQELPKAAAHLSQVQKSLDAYANVTASPGSQQSPPLLDEVGVPGGNLTASNPTEKAL